MKSVPTLTTPRFTMRPLRRSDTAALLTTLGDQQQCLYLTRPAFASEEELWGWLADPEWPGRTWIAEGRGIAQGAAGQVAGRFVATPGHEDGIVEIGYIVTAAAQGKGAASECTAALIDHLFSAPKDDNAGDTTGEGSPRKLTAEVDPRNTASVRLLEKLGFTREAHFREHETTHIGLCDVYWYGLLRSSYGEHA
ncbi:MAG: GNAT family protein [Erythrobacter sp.]